MRTALPANWVGAGYGVPQVCSRHGEPAVQVARMRLQSRPPRWAYALLALGALPFLIAVNATRKIVVAPSWPFCAQCKALRVRRLIIGLVVLAAGAALPVIGGAVASGVPGQPNRESGSVILIGAMLGIVVMLAGLAVAVRSARAPLARAQVSRDGAWVEVLKPDGRFAAQVAALQQAHPQHGYAQQNYPQQSHPQQSHPQQSHPQQNYAQQSYPQQGGYQLPQPW